MLDYEALVLLSLRPLDCRADLLREVVIRERIGVRSLAVEFLLWHLPFFLLGLIALLALLWGPSHIWDESVRYYLKVDT